MNPPSQSSTPPEWIYLAPNSKSAYKQLFIKGTRIRAEVVYRLSVGREPMTAEEIAADYGLPLEAVKEAIRTALRKRPAALVVDFSAVDFLASAGMGVLVAVHDEVVPDVGFCVVADGPATSRPLRLVGIADIVRIYPTLDEALAALDA